MTALPAAGIDESIKILWDKIRSASLLITQMRDENRGLLARVEELSAEVASLREELGKREQDLRRLRTDHAAYVAASSTANEFTPEDRESMKNRMRELISKINSHL
jgi:uncharacterized coiled-coil DUF342 family protein